MTSSNDPKNKNKNEKIKGSGVVGQINLELNKNRIYLHL